jgi:hypothetical protein
VQQVKQGCEITPKYSTITWREPKHDAACVRRWISTDAGGEPPSYNVGATGGGSRRWEVVWRCGEAAGVPLKPQARPKSTESVEVRRRWMEHGAVGDRRRRRKHATRGRRVTGGRRTLQERKHRKIHQFKPMNIHKIHRLTDEHADKCIADKCNPM